MKYKIPQQIIFEFAEKLLGEANVGEVSETDLESMIYESGGRSWEESADGEFYFIDDFED